MPTTDTTAPAPPRERQTDPLWKVLPWTCVLMLTLMLGSCAFGILGARTGGMIWFAAITCVVCMIASLFSRDEWIIGGTWVAGGGPALIVLLYAVEAVKERQMNSLLSAAVVDNDLARVEYSLGNADEARRINDADSSGQYPLDYAVRRGNPAMIQTLLTHGARLSPAAMHNAVVSNVPLWVERVADMQPHMFGDPVILAIGQRNLLSGAPASLEDNARILMTLTRHYGPRHNCADVYRIYPAIRTEPSLHASVCGRLTF